MIKLFVKTKCLGCEKAENFLKKSDVRFERINLSYAPIEEEELFLMQKIVDDNNMLDIINFNSKFFQNEQEKEELKKYRPRDVITFIMNNVDVLSFPIALEVDEKNEPKKLFIGYNDGEYKKIFDDEYSTFETYYSNISKSYIFKHCCFYDEVELDDTNILVNLKK